MLVFIIWLAHIKVNAIALIKSHDNLINYFQGAS